MVTPNPSQRPQVGFAPHTWVPYFLLILVTLPVSSTATDERTILMELFDGTNGVQWLKKDKWGTEAPICSWQGISCLGGTSGDSDVDTIQLPDNNIAGSIPPSLYSMPLLRFLDLEGNPLTNAGFEGFNLAAEGTGMSVSPLETLALNGCNLRDVTGIGKAPASLQDLRLADNNLVGDFPEEIFQVTTLRRLFLDQNGITGTIPKSIGNMDMLIDFHAIGVPFKGEIPTEVGLLTRLVTMVLRDNDFVGQIPTELNTMVNLEILSIGRSPEAGQGQLGGPLPSFSQLPYLELLDLSLNKLTGTIPRDFLLGNQRTDDLVIVRLDGNELTGTLPKQLGWIDSMDLGLTDNKIEGPIPEEICEKKQWMTGLVEQFACDAILCPAGTYSEEGKHTLTSPCEPCQGTAAASSYLGQTSCGGSSSSSSSPLTILAQFYTSLQGESWLNSDGWSVIDTLLQNKKLSDLKASDADVCTFYGVTCNDSGDVQRIELSDNRLYGVVPSSVFSIATLEVFDVSSNRVTMDEDSFEKIGDASSITKLVLSHTDVNSLVGLRNTDSLQELYLDGISLEDSLPVELFTLTNLVVLECSNSKIQGTLPTQIGRLRNLRSAEFRWNDMSGGLPTELGLLANLEKLDLSYNRFEGGLPEELNSLGKLKELELSRAKRGGLGGQLPPLVGLSSLEILGLSYNDFQGSIPSQFLSGVADKSHSMKVSLSYNRLTGVVPHELDHFAAMVLELEGNMITDLPSVFCDNQFWMEGYEGSATFGCNAILCPPGTWNINGRETRNSVCEPCDDNEFYGATQCGGSTSDAPPPTQAPGSPPTAANAPTASPKKSQEAILDMLYAATNGKEWTGKHAGWDVPGSPACDRDGISCDDEGNIDALRLNGYGLNGQIPTEIFQLPKNRVLGFTDNNVDLRFDGIENSEALETLLLSNTKVRSLEGLQHASPSLRSIHLARNDLDGTFPKSILSLTELRKLYINQNKLSGPIPTEISSLSELEELQLWDNHLTGHLPSEIGLLTGLSEFDVKSNLFSGPIPVELGNLAQAQLIDLSDQRSDDKLSGPLFAFSSNTLLRSLNVSKNAFAGTIPSDLLSSVDKTKTVTLDMSHNKLIGGIPEEFANFDSFDLYLADNMISSIPSSLCSMSNWIQGTVGTLGSCDAILCPPSTFSEIGRANATAACKPCTSGNTAVYYGSTSCSSTAAASERDVLLNFFNGVNGDQTWLSKVNWGESSGICTWFGVTCDEKSSVIEIKLASNQIVSTKDQLAFVAPLFELPNLSVLDLKGNSVYLDFEQITFSPSLQSLRVSGTGLASLAGISRAKGLRRLHATDNLLNGTLPDELFELSDLKSLYLSFNSIGGSIPAKVSKLSSLQEFYMYGNRLNKNLPTELGALQNLKELVLSRNFLTGSIPSVFNSMKNLEQLSLYDQLGEKSISGPVPTFENSPNLWFFDASDCDLTGTIPSNFMKNSVHKNATVTLVFKNNELTGTVPSSLKAFDAIDIDLSGNKIEGISSDLCKKEGWMKGEVEVVGSCDAILCPQGQYNEHGRQKSVESPCQPCKDLETVPYMGQTGCKSFEGERGALSLLYSSAGGNQWTSKNRWNSDSPICSWEGIECDQGTPQDDEGVTAIKLEKKNLAGSFPSALWSLPSLRTLLLSGNSDLTISLDGLSNAADNLEVLQISNVKMEKVEGIEQASSLRELYIDENGLTGTFPREIFELHASLEKLRFSANYFYGPLPTEITKMTKLVEFHAANNEFYSTIPSELAQLDQLQSVALNENLFFGTLPTELSTMPNLQIFSARRERKSGPKLSGKVPSFNKNPNLTVLFLDGNAFSGAIPDDFLQSSTSVYLVDLKNNSLSGGVPESLDDLKELDIRLEGNQIKTLPSSFCDNTDWMGGNVGRLKSCDAIMCSPGSASPSGRALSSPNECQKCTSPKAAPFYGSRNCDPVLTEKEILIKLYDATNGAEWKISKNWNSDVDICDWHGIGCKDGNVILINLGANNLSGTPPPELFQLPKLEILWLNSNPIEFSFQNIGRATNLMDLRVDETALSSLAGVGAANSLTSLHAGFNSLSGGFPQELLKLKNMRTLVLNNNAFTGAIPDLTDLSFLRTLRLGSNKFSGPVPAFDGMHILNTIDLSGNQLSGSIPANFLERVGQKLTLEINLSNNKVVGTVPSALARFDDLSLYLRGNMIGDIPNVLCDKSKWNGGDVGKFGCDGLLCAPGTSTFDGRHSSRSPACSSCSAAEDFFGQAVCATSDYSSATTRKTGLFFLAGSAVLGMLLFL